MQHDGRQLPMAGLANLLVIYVVWGSTYLAIRIAVREGAGWGPFWLGASRVLVASAILFLLGLVRGVRLRPSPSELRIIAVSGLLMWVGGNGAVIWAERSVDSGLVALIVGSLPMWTVLIDSVLDRRPPSTLMIMSLLTGFAGLAVLTLPMIHRGLDATAAGVVAVIFGTIAWATGALLLQRKPVRLDSMLLSGWQQLAGGCGFLVLVLVFNEPLPRPIPGAWAAWGYLVVFGSVLAFSSFMYVLRALPVSIVMTYTYVNPVIAVLLGWMILAEPVTRSTLFGAALIVAGVFGVFRDRVREDRGSR